MARRKPNPEADPVPAEASGTATTTVAPETTPRLPSNELPPSDTNGTAPLDEGSTPPPAEKKRPAHCLSVPAGPGAYIEVAIWPRVIQLDGKEMTAYSVTFAKHYKANGRWDSTSFFRGSELHLVEYLARRANEWILGQRTTDCPF